MGVTLSNMLYTPLKFPYGVVISLKFWIYLQCPSAWAKFRVPVECLKMALLACFLITINWHLGKQKPRFYTGFLLLIGGNAWESNPPLGLTRDISFEGCGAHQGHIRFQTYGTPDRIWTCNLLLRRQALYPTELRAQMIKQLTTDLGY